MSKKRKEYLRTKYKDHHWQAYFYFDGICQKCGEFLVFEEESTLHHLKYSLGYMDDMNVRIDEVQLLCYACHRVTHMDIHPNCAWCGNKARGGYDRMFGTGLHAPICRKCYGRIYRASGLYRQLPEIDKQIRAERTPGEVAVSRGTLTKCVGTETGSGEVCPP